MESKQNFKNYRKDIEKKAKEYDTGVIPYLGNISSHKREKRKKKKRREKQKSREEKGLTFC